MESKLVIAFLGESAESNAELIEFIHSSFRRSHVSFVYKSFPDYAWCKRLGDQLKSELEKAPGYYESTNRYNLINQTSGDLDVLRDQIRCSDLILGLFHDEEFIADQLETLEISRGNRPPVLYLPPSFSGRINQLVFLAFNNSGIKGFQKFCYLFPDMVKKAPTMLLNFQAGKEEERESGSQAKFNYLRSKCEDLSVHKIVGSIEKKDGRALNWGMGTCIILDNAFNKGDIGGLLSALDLKELTQFEAYG